MPRREPLRSFRRASEPPPSEPPPPSKPLPSEPPSSQRASSEPLSSEPPDLPATGDADLDRRLLALTDHDADLLERVLERRVVERGRYLAYEIDTVVLADGSVRRRDIVDHPGAVAMVALDERDQVLLVRQFRLASGRVLLEIPAGTLDRLPGGTVEEPAVAARRELEEETGYRADRWRRLGSFWTAPGFARERMTLFLADGLRPAEAGDRRGPDEDERLQLVRLSWNDAVRAAETGAIADAKTLLGILWVDRLRATGAGGLDPLEDGSTPGDPKPSRATPAEDAVSRLAGY